MASSPPGTTSAPPDGPTCTLHPPAHTDAPPVVLSLPALPEDAVVAYGRAEEGGGCSKWVASFRGPTRGSNWVFRGLLLVGGYPGHIEAAAHEQRVGMLVDYGVRTFVTLQTERELERFNAFRPVVEALVDDAAFVAFGIPDSGTRDDDDVLAFVDELVGVLGAAAAAGSVVYMHCWGGHGRTGTILALLLVRLLSIDPHTALVYVALLHATRVYKPTNRSPESAAQFEQVARLGAAILSSGSVAAPST